MSTNRHNGAHGQNEHGRHQGPLSIKQRRAIELLLNGLSDSQVAAELELRRETINRWKHHHAGFRAAFETEQERLWLLGRAQREIEVAKRHTPVTAPSPLDDQYSEDDLRRSPALCAALGKQARLWIKHEKAVPLTHEEEALLLAHPQHVAYALRQIQELWNRTDAAGKPVGGMLLLYALEMNEHGQRSEYVPFWFNQSRQLSKEEQQECEELEKQAAVEWVRELEASGMKREDAIRDVATIHEMPRAELERRLAAAPDASQQITPHKLPGKYEGV